MGELGREAGSQRLEAEQLWGLCTDALRGKVSEAAWRACFAEARPVSLEAGRLVLGVPSTFARQRLQDRHLPLVADVASQAAKRRLSVELTVLPAPPAPVEPETGGPPGASLPFGTEPILPRRDGPTRSASQPEFRLDPRYTFDKFVIGTSNRFAHAAALSVAEQPARSYNPLFIHGGSGLGKTHLLHAIGHYVQEHLDAKYVAYVSTETFMNEFVHAIRTNKSMDFKHRYRECDVLLVDDIQFMEHKEGLQEEFFYTFNTLYGAAKQIVITSDRPPKRLSTLEDRLRSRFLSGLITDVQPPELETRLAILAKKAGDDGATVPAAVLEFIATHVTDNIRELEGALLRVCAYASLNGQSLTHGLAEVVLADIVSSTKPRVVTPGMILDATSKTFGFTVEELKSASRRRPLVTARQIGMYVFRELTDFSYPAIAREFGGRDHTTVIHAVEKISALMGERRQIYEQVIELIHLIKTGG